MSDFGIARQGIRGGPPFSVNGIAVETLANKALDHIQAEVIGLRKRLEAHHEDADLGDGETCDVCGFAYIS